MIYYPALADMSTIAVFVALSLFVTLTVLLSLFVRRTMHSRPTWQQSTTYPPHPGYYSVQENRRVYNQPEAQ